MKKFLLAALFTIVVLPFSGALAQSDDKPAPSKTADNKVTDGNYVLTLVANAKDQPAKELSVVVATPTFNTSSTDPAANFAGTCKPQGNGTYLVDYTLTRTVAVPAGGNAFNYRSVPTLASVQLRLGEPIEIIKDGDLFYTLKLDRYKAPAH